MLRRASVTISSLLTATKAYEFISVTVAASKLTYMSETKSFVILSHSIGTSCPTLRSPNPEGRAGKEVPLPACTRHTTLKMMEREALHVEKFARCDARCSWIVARGRG